MKRIAFASLVVVALLAGTAPARADEPEPPPQKHLGIGYKIGNGLGVVGADVLVSPIPHITLDLQANYFSATSPDGSKASGYGLAPTLQFHFFSGQRSSPYISAGFLYATLTLENVTASGKGAVANAGYEWRWPSGLGILVGGGINYLASIHATDGTTTIDSPSFTNFNIEAGLRYMFL
jgi:hypothetical protein